MLINDNEKNQVFTIDGPAGVGKTTIAKNVAQSLNIAYLDTGAMFRSLALKLGSKASLLSEDALYEKCSAYIFKVKGIGINTILFCNGEPITNEIRTEEVGMLASKLAVIPCIRKYLKEIQQSIGHRLPLVVEGRDMGTVVFPSATFKFFLDAKPEVRALRRFLELEKKGEKHDLSTIIEQICKRDALDRNRTISPLRPADNAIIIDTSSLSIPEVQNKIMSYVEKKI